MMIVNVNGQQFCFFLTSGLFFFGCVWYLYAGSMNPEYYWQKATGFVR